LSTETPRGTTFTKKLNSRLINETPCKNNSFVTSGMSICGYSHSELLHNICYSDFIYLLFKQELPSKKISKLFKQYCIAFGIPSLRNPASQAIVAGAVGKTRTTSLISIGVGLFGSKDGAGQTEDIMKQFNKCNSDIGFGTIHGDIDTYASKLLNEFSDEHHTKTLLWAKSVNEKLVTQNQGILMAGLSAAILCDVGILPKDGPLIYQSIVAPGLAAHAAQFKNKPLTDYFFESDDDYIISSE